MRIRLFSVMAASVLGLVLGLHEARGAVKPRESTPEEKARRAERRLNALHETGGFIADPRDASGTYLFIDCGCGADETVLKTGAAKCQNSCMILVGVKKEARKPFSFAAAEEMFGPSGAIMATFLIDEEAWPLEVVCPERRWAAVNVRRLKADNPAKEVFEQRIRKMMSRSVGQLFQAGYAFSSVSTMNLIRTIDDLDRIATEGLATECTTVIQATAEKFGFKPMKRALYYKACMEGWAPPPVNEFQKSAWDRAKAEKERGPANPIKIEKKK